MNAHTKHSLFRLDQATILVTGASSGIGQACAVEFARMGARVILTGRNVERLNEVCVELPGEGHEIIAADLQEEEQLEMLAEACPSLNGVTHCAGIGGVSPMHLLQRAMIDNVFNTNYFAPIMLTQRLLRKKKISVGGSILFMSSIAAKTGKVGVGPYAGSKAALIGSMRPLALEVAKHRIRVNALCPGIVVTPLFKDREEWLREEVALGYPLGLGKPEDIAYASVFFMSRASSKITGTSFSIDGGIPFT
jgi:NAD(P)-dependent dehydrogenase (short-subunit alcohol dehydrogenase family)